MQHGAFLDQRLERQHDAVADVALHLLAQDARGNERQDGLLAADDQRMAGVVAALEARHGGGALGQEVDNLALAFIAPLRADDDDELAQRRPLTLLAHQKQKDHADQHAAQPRDAQLTIGHVQEPGEGPLDPAGMQKRGDALEHEE